MIIADAIITNMVYRSMRGVRTKITPTSINHRKPNITKRMITDVFIVTAKLIIFSIICKIRQCKSGQPHLNNRIFQRNP